MTIAVHISAGKHEDLSDNFNFISFSEMALAQPESHFIFIFDSPPHPELYLEPNCTPVIQPPAIRNTLLSHYWYNYKLPSVIQKYNADILITVGLSCSFRLNIPQCLFVNKARLLSAEKSLHLKKFVPAFLKTAQHVFTTEAPAFDMLQSRPGLSDKTSLLYPGLQIELNPLSFEERESVKAEYTGGNEFFLHFSSVNEFDSLKIIFKAFSIFKKWQKSSMRMVVIVNSNLARIISKELALYKYKGDVVVHITNNLNLKLLASAYALLVENIDLFNVVLPAMSGGVPVIAKKHVEDKDLEGAIVANWDEKNISEKMMLLYKDEFVRSQAIQDGRQNAAKYSWKDTTEKIWNVLQKLVHSQTA